MPRHVTIHPSVLYVGTPVILVGTQNPDGSANLAPASSYWALGQMLALGLEADGQSVANVLERPELTVSFPSPELWRSVEALGDVTGRSPVPDGKAARYQHAGDKFALAGLTTLASLAASLTLAIAALEPDADPDALFTAGNLEEDWQAEQWGWDADAQDRRKARLDAFGKAARFTRAARG